MASDLVPDFMHKTVLEAEIERLRTGDSFEELELFGLDGEFCLEVQELGWENNSIQIRSSCRPLFEPLRPLFAGYCRASSIEYGQLPYRWITSFDCLLDCANAFDALLRQAVSTDRTLYVWVSY